MESMIQKILADRLEKQGFDWVELKGIRFSKADRRFELDLELDGEESTLPVILDYEVEGETIKIVNITTSKRWIKEVLQLVLLAKGGAFPIPTGMKGSLVKMLI